MSFQGLQLEVRRFCGAPLIRAKGYIDGSHDVMLASLLRSFKLKGHADLILDLTESVPVGPEGHESLVQILKSWHPEMRVHLVATGATAETLRSGDLPFTSHLCSSVDAAAQQICRFRREPHFASDLYAEDEEYGADLRLAA